MKRTAMTILAAVLGISLAASAAEVDRREQRQQERIAQGVQSGQLTPAETARLERKEARIQREIHLLVTLPDGSRGYLPASATALFEAGRHQ